MSPFWFRKKSDRNRDNPPPGDSGGGADKFAEILDIPASFAEARQLFEQRAHRESKAILERLLGALDHAKGPAVDDMRGKVLGLIANNYYQSGDMTQARAFNRKALEECRRVDDQVGIRAYRTNARFLNNQPVSQDPRTTELEVALLKKLDRSQRLSDQSRCKESNQLLENILHDKTFELPALMGHYSGKIHGLMAENLLMLGDRAAARRFTELAIEDCGRDGDDDGVRVYTHNLQSIAQLAR